MGYSYVFNPLSGSFDTVQDVSGFVPYTGATSDVTLGNNHLNVQTTGSAAINVAARSINLAASGPVVFNDTFTETVNTTLANHTPDTGSSWSVAFANGVPTLRVVANVGYCNAPANAANSGILYRANTVGAIGNDYEVSAAVLQIVSNTNTLSLVARYTDANNFYCLNLSSSLAQFTLMKRVAGVNTVLGTMPILLTANKTVKLRVVGDQIAVVIGSRILSYFTDADLPTGGVGLGIGNINQDATYDVSTTWRVDSFRVQQYVDSDLTAIGIDVDGNLSVKLQTLGQSDDSVTTPSFSWSADTSTGFYRSGAGTIGITNNGVQTGFFYQAGLVVTEGGVTAPTGTSAAPSFRFSSDTNTGFYRHSANIIGVSVNGALRFTFGGDAGFASPLSANIGIPVDIRTHLPISNTGGSSGGIILSNPVDGYLNTIQADNSFPGLDMDLSGRLAITTGMQESANIDSSILFLVGNTDSGARVGDFSISFDPVDNAKGGTIYLSAGQSSLGNNGGDIYLTGGYSVEQTGGNVYINSGSGVTDGVLKLQNNGNAPISIFNATGASQATTGIAGATRVAGVGATVKDDDTFGGYTIAQVVAALRSYGWLA